LTVIDASYVSDSSRISAAWNSKSLDGCCYASVQNPQPFASGGISLKGMFGSLERLKLAVSLTVLRGIHRKTPVISEFSEKKTASVLEMKTLYKVTLCWFLWRLPDLFCEKIAESDQMCPSFRE
jgi:hypothetical protein